MKVAILKCRDCGAELNRTAPFPDEERAKISIFSVFAAGPCPNGCRATFRDLNLNTKLVVEEESANEGAQ